MNNGKGVNPKAADWQCHARGCKRVGLYRMARSKGVYCAEHKMLALPTGRGEPLTVPLRREEAGLPERVNWRIFCSDPDNQ